MDTTTDGVPAAVSKYDLEHYKGKHEHSRKINVGAGQFSELKELLRGCLTWVLGHDGVKPIGKAIHSTTSDADV